MNMENILIIGAHYDDTELGAGGTAAKLASAGARVYKLTLTDNDVNPSVFNKRTEYEKSLMESRKACQLLNMCQIEDFQPEKVCALTYDTKMMQQIEKVILDKKIDTVFMHSEFDTNEDHAQAGKLCKTAARHCKNLLIYQSNLYIMQQPFYPTVFFDISAFIELKKSALQQYGTEHQRYSSLQDTSNTLFDNVILRNQTWGFSNGVKYAEGFLPLKMLY